MNKQERRKLRKRVSIGIFSVLGLIIIMMLLPKELSKQEENQLDDIVSKLSKIRKEAQWRIQAGNTPTNYIDAKIRDIAGECTNIQDEKTKAERKKQELISEYSNKKFKAKEDVENHNKKANEAVEKTIKDINDAQQRARNALYKAIQHAKGIRRCVDTLTPKSERNKVHLLASTLTTLLNNDDAKTIQDEDAKTIEWFKENLEKCKTNQTNLTNLHDNFDNTFYKNRKKYREKIKDGFDQIEQSFDIINHDLDKEITSYTNFWSENRDKKCADILANASKVLGELEAINIDDIREKIMAEQVTETQELPILKPGEAELSICVQSKTLADDLVILFLSEWWRSNRVSVTTVSAQNGIRYELTKNGESWKTDVIYPSEQMQEQKSHLSFSIASTRNTGQIEEIICSDALVFIPQKEENTEKKPKMSEEEIKTASKTWDANNNYLGKAVELFFGPTSPQAGEDSLKIDAYHVRAEKQRALDILMPQGAQEASESRRTLKLNDQSIANQTYAYSFHIRSQKRADASKYAEEFHKYMKDNSDFIRKLGFVPYNTQVDTNIQELIEEDFPIERILAFMEKLKQDKKIEADIKRTIEGLGYIEGTGSLRGFEFSFPLFFDTDNDEEMKRKEEDGSVEEISQEILDRVKKEIDETIQGLPYDHLMVVVTGHADVRGEEWYNQNLSQNRAMTLTKAVLAKELQKLKRINDIAYSHKHYEQPETEEEPEKNVLILSIGCSSDYHMVSKKENITGKAADDYYRRDRRASIFIIVPSSEKR